MSDLNAAPDAAASAPTADAAPAEMSTAEIAAEVMADAAEADASEAAAASDATPDVTPDVTAEEDKPAAADAPKEDEDDEDAIQERDASGRINKIPAPRVSQMLKKAKARVAKEWEGKLAEHTQKVAAFEQEFQHMAAVEQMMQTDPDAFIQSLVQINPTYARYLGQAGAAGHQQAPQASAGMPEPDYDLGNGQKTYSTEGLQRLLAWQQQDAVRQAEERVSQRFAPMEQQYRAQAERQQALPKVQALIQEAHSWPGFKENEGDILKALRADQSLTLERAYLKVITPKMTADRNAMKQEWLKELKGRPASTSVPATTPATPSTAKTTADIAREVMARAK